MLLAVASTLDFAFHRHQCIYADHQALHLRKTCQMGHGYLGARCVNPSQMQTNIMLMQISS